MYVLHASFLFAIFEFVSFMILLSNDDVITYKMVVFYRTYPKMLL
jgi:hypothetical protein